MASGRVVSPFILTYSVVPDVRSHEQLAVCARKETIKCTIKSVANATWGVRLSGGHISLKFSALDCLPRPSGGLSWGMPVLSSSYFAPERWGLGGKGGARTEGLGACHLVTLLTFGAPQVSQTLPSRRSTTLDNGEPADPTVFLFS